MITGEQRMNGPLVESEPNLWQRYSLSDFQHAVLIQNDKNYIPSPLKVQVRHTKGTIKNYYVLSPCDDVKSITSCHRINPCIYTNSKQRSFSLLKNNPTILRLRILLLETFSRKQYCSLDGICFINHMFHSVLDCC